MKGYRLYCKFIILLAVMVLITPRFVFCASSENYQVPESVLNGGGGEMSSPNYSTLSSHGHPISGNLMQSPNFAVSSGFVASAHPAIEATIDIDPNTLNLRSQGRWITCFVTLPDGYPQDVFDPTSVALTRVNGQTLDSFIFSDLDAIHEGEDDADTVLKVKLPRSEVQVVVPVGDEVELTITGNLLDGATFQGTDKIRVIDPGEQKGNQQQKGEPARAGKAGK